MAGHDGNRARLALSLAAFNSGRVIELGKTDRPVLMICFGQETQVGIEAVEAVAREIYPSDRRLIIGHVIDLHKIPSLLRKIAENVLGGEHAKAVAALPPGAAAEDYVVMLPDWDGSLVSALGLEDATKTLGLALVEPDGLVAWRYQGEAPAEAVRAELERRREEYRRSR
ncbi:MAG TPA: hypothetical protein VNN10_03835 [Dehalococcoidia bacterium]|nr:hypothetical protein [Dehalococcoidia bacterium]